MGKEPRTEPETIETTPDAIPFATTGLEGVPTYFVEHIRGTIFTRGFIKLNMIENRLDAIDQDLKAVHVVNIITPVDQIRAWAKYLTDIADRHDLPTEEQILAEAEAKQAAEGDQKTSG